jgi:hypothetical protein
VAQDGDGDSLLRLLDRPSPARGVATAATSI